MPVRRPLTRRPIKRGELPLIARVADKFAIGLRKPVKK